MKKLKIIIIMLTVMVVVLIISIVFIKKDGLKNKQNIATSEKEVETPLEQKEEISRVEYHTINKVIDIYLRNLNKKNYIDVRGTQLVSDNEIKQNILNLLSENYVEKNNINLENLEKYIKLKEEPLLFVPIKMKGTPIGNVKTYTVQGFTIDYDYKLKDEINIIINLDYKNRTFSIEPTIEEYDEIKITDNLTAIEEKSNNKYNSSGVNTENITRDYIDRLKRICLTKPDLLYDYLEEEYREKRIKNVENFKKYVEKNYEEIRNININGCLVNTDDGYSQYVGKDKYNNIYIFNEKDPLNYKIKLDTYTINSKEFKNKYNESNNEYKVKLNVDKWIKMLNNRDYENAYKQLDKKFREEKFGTAEEFEKYMRDNFPLHYKLSVGATEEVNGVYNQRIKLKDITGESKEEIDNTIIMQLQDDYEFVMSFEV